MTTKTLTSSAGVYVDEIGVLTAKIKKLQEKLAPLTKAKGEAEKKLLTYINKTFKAGITGSIGGKATVVDFGAKASKATITDKEKAVELLENIEEGLAFDVMTLPITPLREYLGKKELATVISEEKTGARHLKYTAKV